MRRNAVQYLHRQLGQLYRFPGFSCGTEYEATIQVLRTDEQGFALYSRPQSNVSSQSVWDEECEYANAHDLTARWSVA